MTYVTYRLTAKNRDQLRNPTLGNRVWATFSLHLVLIGDRYSANDAAVGVAQWLRLRAYQRGYSTSNPVSTGIGDRRA